MYQNKLISLFHITPFGSAINTRSYSSGAYRYGFNGKETDEESFSGAIAFEARIFDSRLGRFLSLDPRLSEYGWQSPFVYFMNCPISIIDYLGEGDHYDKNGKHLGNDGNNNDVTYVTSQECIDAHTKTEIVDGKEVKTTDWNSVIADSRTEKLSVGHSQFKKEASLIKHESSLSGNASSAKWMAHTANNGLKHKSINLKGKYKTLYELFKTVYSTAPESEKNKELSTSDNSDHANWARSGLISVYLGESDPTGGAVLWDGMDFLHKGHNSNKFKEYKSITISNNILKRYIEDFNKYHHLVNKNFTVNNIFLSSCTKQEYENNEKGWIYDLFKWYGKANKLREYNLIAAGAGGGSIFWKISK